jgi:hypothetical protein
MLYLLHQLGRYSRPSRQCNWEAILPNCSFFAPLCLPPTRTTAGLLVRAPSKIFLNSDWGLFRPTTWDHAGVGGIKVTLVKVVFIP